MSFGKTNIIMEGIPNTIIQHIIKIKLREGMGTSERRSERGEGASH